MFLRPDASKSLDHSSSPSQEQASLTDRESRPTEKNLREPVGTRKTDQVSSFFCFPLAVDEVLDSVPALNGILV